jgi:hypothetical protein
VKSGWAMTVLLAGPVDSPCVLDRRRIKLSDPSVPDTIQPWADPEKTAVVAAWLALTGHW